MPYLEDGETWSNDMDMYEEGMAENKPGHKSFSSYKLPSWCKHPLSHPFNGVLVGPKEYMYMAGDGFTNPMGWSVAHIAAKFGDVSILEMATEEELNRPDVQGQTPANYAVQYGTPWCLQWMVEKGVDTTTPDLGGHTPEDTIWRTPRLHNAEMEWIFQALKGELTEKNNIKSQEYRLVKNRAPGLDPMVTERLDKDMKKLRKYWFNMGDYEIPYSIIPEDFLNRPLDLPLAKVVKPEKKKPAVPAALLFPGQGSQYVGMLKDVVDKPAVKAMLEKAAEILGWDPKELALNGPESRISETRYCQPLMFIAGLAAREVLRETKPDAYERPQATAGLSLGEYTAIVAAGVLSFEDGLRLVQIRGEAMQRATELVPQAMCSVAGLDRAKVDRLCEEAKKSDPAPNPECKVANFLFPSGFTCAGTKDSVQTLCNLAMQAKALQARIIKAGGAFHTRLMQPAQDELNKALDDLADKMQPPVCAIYFNVTGKRVAAGADPATFIELMKMQLTNEVMWEPTIKAMIMDGVKDFYEVGPLKQIKAMIKRIDADAFKRTENIPV
uniref:Malonyl-CoA:ACP transacylase (MAT) domain-containing protein n=1 Tax=Pyrodinium bahamense TaxID=73915 RepID=A0A7R9ZVC8_9DINO|mmetsp:Transcript_11268/g.30742  ORF Transcript_11268/g.30742 Transcript_11268/m.30742 type:complete len:555 (+) Transcript_11268:72-1736(+)|eukprot:CAMPEP_0179048288 /NCGR_PEP_ID=MMETSP0796-20121207/19634_1 /TAXON_ID=73915 /ORGANISM="Pyrodinium bahamense, Strain pbaha01" /LENGTH=554 /DNA_ID=CAMNT_0020744757 /DNA_START=72 /DNA_END=1736 /DNA_ORIENTATION=-